MPPLEKPSRSSFWLLCRLMTPIPVLLAILDWKAKRNADSYAVQEHQMIDALKGEFRQENLLKLLRWWTYNCPEFQVFSGQDVLCVSPSSRVMVEWESTPNGSLSRYPVVTIDDRSIEELHGETQGLTDYEVTCLKDAILSCLPKSFDNVATWNKT